MKKHIFSLYLTLPGLNEYTKACRANFRVGAAMKKKAENDISSQLAGRKPVSITKRVDVKIEWYEPTARRDPDNIAFATKFILDTFVRFGYLPGDDQKRIRSISHAFFVDKDNPRIIVTLEEP